jgi:hypothetical protein
MTKYSNKKSAGIRALVVLALAASTATVAIGSAAAAHSGNDAADSPQGLRATLLQSNELRGFWTLNCPTAAETTGAYGTQLSVHEQLRSSEPGNAAASSATRFASPRAAQADLRRELDAVAGGGESLVVTGVPGAVGYRFDHQAATDYRIWFVEADTVYSLSAQVPSSGPASFQADLTAAARAVAARAS